jgi:O-antigen ligase
MAVIEISIAQNELVRRLRGLPFAITLENVVFALFVAGLAWVPFWLGSNRLVAWGINAVIFPGLAALYEFSLLIRAKARPVPLRRVGLSAVLLAIVAIWVLVQNATWTPSEWQHPIWQLAANALGQSLAGSISVDRDLTVLALLRLMTAASVFWLALQLCHDAARARWLIWSLIGISAVYAAVGMFALGFMRGGRIFPELGPIKLLTSTFVNQNHYVTFAGIGLIAAMGMTLRRYRRDLGTAGRGWQMKLAALIRTTGGTAALPLALGSVILVALMLTGSRGGIISTALGVSVLFVLSMGKTKARNEVLFLGFAGLMVGVAFFAFGDVFVGRITDQGLYDQGRPAVLKVTIRSILSAPFLGFGYGTFSSAFPMFRDDSTSIAGFWDKAHNTYIEVFQGLGLVFGAMLIGCVVTLVWDCLKGAKTRRRGATIPAIAASVSFLLGTHALIDFSLQIQAVALTYMAVLGAGVAQARDPSADVTFGGKFDTISGAKERSR